VAAGAALVLVTHDERDVSSLAEEIVEMEAGRLHADARAAETSS
jgi:ABC-type sulfate/molybdate transport systems ATPase subunit